MSMSKSDQNLPTVRGNDLEASNEEERQEVGRECGDGTRKETRLYI